MRVEITSLIVVLALALTISISGCRKPQLEVEPGEAKLLRYEAELLRYEAVDFGKLLAKVEPAPISTERDPFRSSLQNLKLLGSKEEGHINVFAAESLKLTGVIRGPRKSIALIQYGPDMKTYAVKENDTIGKFYVKEVRDEGVILTTDGESAILKLGGGDNVYYKE